MGAPTLAELVVADPPETWRAAGFTVDDDGVCTVGSVRVRLVGPEGGKRIVSWSLRDVPEGTTAVDGLPTAVSSDPPPAGTVTHANGVEVIDHLVVLSPDVDRTVAAFEAIGLDVRRTRHVDPEQYGFEARQTFFRAGEVVLELIGADAPMEGSEGRPAGFFGLAYTVRDLDATAALLADHIGRVKDAVQPGRRITTLRHKDLGMSVATAFMSRGPTALE